MFTAQIAVSMLELVFTMDSMLQTLRANALGVASY
jgi:hypothetical protein